MNDGSESGIGVLSGVCIVVNLLMGSGYLAMPHSFFEGGLLASTVVLLLVLGTMVVTCVWESKCVVRAARILNSSKIPEVAEAMRVYCGNFWRNVYISVLALSIGTSSWVFAILFADTLSASVPLYRSDVICGGASRNESDESVCQTRYILNVILLGLITTPLALMDVKEQAIIQNILAVTRVLRCSLMIITPLMATSAAQLSRGFPFADSAHAMQTPMLVGSLDGVFVVMSVCVFSFFLNSSVPIFIDALSNVKHALKILILGFLISACLYWVLSAVGSFTFGSSISTTCNLAWHGFRWPFMNECATGSVCDMTSRVVEYIVVFSPVLDVVSIYPLGTIVLANSVWEVVFGVPHHEFPGAIDQVLVDHYKPMPRCSAASTMAAPTETTTLLRAAPGEDVTMEGGGEANSSSPVRQQLYRKAMRFVLNVLPLILAILVRNFLQIVSFAGSVSVLICLVFPAFLSLKCSSYEEEHGIPAKTINEKNHLQWCDSPMQTIFPERLRAQRVESGSTHTNDDHGYCYDPENSIIEKRWFKLAVIYVGFFVTAIIFYSSVAPVPSG